MPRSFSKPLVIWLDPNRRDFGTTSISDVAQGLMALHRYGLGEFRADRRGRPRKEWQQAAGALVLAKMDPTPANVAHARAALEKLARAAGSLAGENVQRSNPFEALTSWRRLA